MTADNDPALARLEAEAAGSMLLSVQADCAAIREENRALRAEVDRLRSLPVIQTCGQCGFQRAGLCVLAGRANYGDRPVDPAAPPPSWCPLRGKAGGR